MIYIYCWLFLISHSNMPNNNILIVSRNSINFFSSRFLFSSFYLIIYFHRVLSDFFFSHHWLIKIGRHIKYFKTYEKSKTIFCNRSEIVLFLFFLWFSIFCEFQSLFYQNTFVLTFYFGLQDVKIHKLEKNVFSTFL